MVLLFLKRFLLLDYTIEQQTMLLSDTACIQETYSVCETMTVWSSQLLCL